MNKAVGDLCRIYSQAKAKTPLDDEVPAMSISTSPGLYQSEFFDNDEDLRPTIEDIYDIDTLPFLPGVISSREFQTA